jgi:hypothetical protein
VLTLSVVAEAHSGLAETNGVLSSADSIELLEFRLVDTLQIRSLALAMQQDKTPSTHLAGEVKLNGLDTDVLRASRHCGGGTAKMVECGEKGV